MVILFPSETSLKVELLDHIAILALIFEGHRKVILKSPVTTASGTQEKLIRHIGREVCLRIAAFV